MMISLSSIADDNLLVRVSGLSGDEAYLVVRYEHTPGIEELDAAADELGLVVNEAGPFGRSGAVEGMASNRAVVDTAFSELVLAQGLRRRRWVGAKIFYYHRREDPIWERFAAEDHRVIHLWRDATFDQYVSRYRCSSPQIPRSMEGHGEVIAR